MGRFSLAGLLWFVAFIAFGFAAVRNASTYWVGATFLVTLGWLCASVLGVILERSRGGVWWHGFAVFGWAFLVAGLIPSLNEGANALSKELAQGLYSYSRTDPIAMHRVAMNAVPSLRVGPDGQPIAEEWLTSGQIPLSYFLTYHEQQRFRAALIGHWLFVLIFARAGATVSYLFTKDRPWQRRPVADGPATVVPHVP